MKQKKHIKVAICVDVMGSDFGATTPEDEVERHVDYYSDFFRPAKFDWYRVDCISDRDIKPGTDLILFDFGGMLPGNSLMEDNSRRLIEWAKDNPSSLCLVVSSFTWHHAVKYEMAELGLDLHNVIYSEPSQDDPIPEWFRMGLGIPNPYAKPHAIAGLLPLGRTLPNVKFFQPRESFLDWAEAEFWNRVVYDCGCGVGQVTKALKLRGLQVVAIDANHREDSEADVEIADATTYEFNKNSVVLLARPCHGPFVEAVVTQAILRKVAMVIYVGKTKNARGDLGGFYSAFAKTMVGAGKDRESVWVWRRDGHREEVKE